MQKAFMFWTPDSFLINKENTYAGNLLVFNLAKLQVNAMNITAKCCILKAWCKLSSVHDMRCHNVTPAGVWHTTMNNGHPGVDPWPLVFQTRKWPGRLRYRREWSINPWLNKTVISFGLTFVRASYHAHA